ncbi:MAG: ABC transporter permease [Bacteroidota bacterium]
MLKNFFLIATRNFLRQRFYSFINILGLSTGLASALFIFLWVRDEVSVDAGYKDSDRLYRIVSNLKMSDDEILTWSITPGPLREMILERVPEAEVVVHTANAGGLLIQYGDKAFLEAGEYADSTFLKIFDFKILKGTVDNLDRSSIAISSKLAKSLFGNEDPIGKVIKVAKANDLEVKAVFDDIKRGFVVKGRVYTADADLYNHRGQGWNWGELRSPVVCEVA